MTRQSSGIALGRIAIVGATKELHNMLRNGAGLSAAGHGAFRSGITPVAYAGHDFRAYDTMTVGGALAFYASLSREWNASQAAADLVLADLDERLDIRRLKRAFARALALAIVVAKPANLVVVEHGEQFDQEPPKALLDAVVARTPNAIVTYADVDHAVTGTFARTLHAAQFVAEYVR